MPDTIIWKLISSLAMTILNEPLGLFSMGVLVVIFSVLKFRKQSAANKEIWKAIRDSKKETDDKINANSVDIATHENRLQMQADHFEVIDKDVDRVKQTSQNALNLCFKMVNYIKNL